MDNKELMELLEQIRIDNDEQNKILRKQNKIYFCTMIAMVVLCVGMLIAVGSLVPRLNKAVDEMTLVTQQINQLELDETIANINELATTGTQSFENINQIDFETLNKAINDFNTAVQPLVRIFGGRN